VKNSQRGRGIIFQYRMVGAHMSSLKNSKIVVVGAGHVGESVAFSLMLKEVASELVMIDVDAERAEGSVFDMEDATAFYSETTVRTGSYQECENADIIIVTAGIARKPGQTRLDLAKTNASIVRSITTNIMEYAKNPIILVVSNPVDVMTAVIQEASKLPVGRVIGTGTMLDTARLRRLISEECEVAVTDVNAYVLGEHGDTQVAVWSRATIGGENLKGYFECINKDLDFEELAKTAKTSGATIIKKKGATFLGIAMCAARICEIIMRNEHAILPVAHVLDASYGEWQGAAISLPSVIGKDGIVRTINIKLSEEEKKAMDHSAKTLKAFKDDVIG